MECLRQEAPESIPSEDEYDIVNDQGIHYKDVQTVEDIQIMEPMEQINPLKRAARKRYYSFLSASKSISPQLVAQSEFVQKASKKREDSSSSDQLQNLSDTPTRNFPK